MTTYSFNFSAAVVAATVIGVIEIAISLLCQKLNPLLPHRNIPLHLRHSTSLHFTPNCSWSFLSHSSCGARSPTQPLAPF